jgi:DNA repair exonuclease SbcCD ATPase subunit
MPNELLDELSSEVEEAQTAHDEGVKEVETEEIPAEQQAEPVESEEEAEEVEEKEIPRIPLPELQAERKKRQETQAELQAEREKFARLDERLNIINEKLAPQEPEIPAYEEDPFEHLRQRENQTGETIEDLKKQMEEYNQQNEAQRAQQELTQRVVHSENEFRKVHADYDDAIQHLREGRAKEYMAMGINDPAQIENMLNQEAVQLAQMAQHNNTNLPEMAYNIAKSRGYQGKTQVDKLDNVEKGQAKSTSLSNAGGSEERVLDLEVLANMDDDDFSKAMKDGQFEKLLKTS